MLRRMRGLGLEYRDEKEVDEIERILSLVPVPSV